MISCCELSDISRLEDCTVRTIHKSPNTHARSKKVARDNRQNIAKHNRRREKNRKIGDVLDDSTAKNAGTLRKRLSGL